MRRSKQCDGVGPRVSQGPTEPESEEPTDSSDYSDAESSSEETSWELAVGGLSTAAAAEEEERKQRPWSPEDSEEKCAVVGPALGGRSKMPRGANAKTARSGRVARTTLRQAR